MPYATLPTHPLPGKHQQVFPKHSCLPSARKTARAHPSSTSGSSWTSYLKQLGRPRPRRHQCSPWTPISILPWARSTMPYLPSPTRQLSSHIVLRYLRASPPGLLMWPNPLHNAQKLRAACPYSQECYTVPSKAQEGSPGPTLSSDTQRHSTSTTQHEVSSQSSLG